MEIYKKGQGMTSRVGAAALFLLIGAFAGNSAYYFLLDVFKQDINSIQLLSGPLIGSVLLFLGVCALGINLSLIRPGSSDYLIDMDIELRKVVWPAVMPLFDPKTEAWGSTYVVIVCTILFTIFVGVVDVVMDFVISQNLLTWILTDGGGASGAILNVL